MNTKNWTSGTFATYLQTWLALPCLLDSKSEVDIRRSRILLSHIHFNRRWRCDASTKKNHHPVSSNTQSRITYSRMRGGGGLYSPAKCDEAEPFPLSTNFTTKSPVIVVFDKQRYQHIIVNSSVIGMGYINMAKRLEFYHLFYVSHHDVFTYTQI